MKWIVGLAFAALLIAAPVAHADEKADAQKLASGWMDEYNNRDAAALAKRYAQDAVFSQAPWTATGPTAIQDGLVKEFADQGLKYTHITVADAQRVGDLAFSYGTWEGEVTGSDGAVARPNGHWMIVARCQGNNCPILYHFLH